MPFYFFTYTLYDSRKWNLQEKNHRAKQISHKKSRRSAMDSCIFIPQKSAAESKKMIPATSNKNRKSIRAHAYVLDMLHYAKGRTPESRVCESRSAAPMTSEPASQQLQDNTRRPVLRMTTGMKVLLGCLDVVNK